MQGLGELESAVMDVLWKADEPMTVRGAREALSSDRKLAYTTVMTVLDNLHRKGWVQREMVRRAYCYRPCMSHEEAATQALRELLGSTSDPDAVLLHFARSTSDHESALLRKALRERRNT